MKGFIGLFSPWSEKMVRNKGLTALKREVDDWTQASGYHSKENQPGSISLSLTLSLFSCAPHSLTPTFPKWLPSFSLVVDNLVEFLLPICPFYVLSFIIFSSGLFVWRKQEVTSKEFSRAVLPPTFSLWVFCGSLVYLLCAASHTRWRLLQPHITDPLSALRNEIQSPYSRI